FIQSEPASCGANLKTSDDIRPWWKADGYGHIRRWNALARTNLHRRSGIQHRFYAIANDHPEFPAAAGERCISSRQPVIPLHDRATAPGFASVDHESGL